MVLAHQHLAQLPRELRETVAANARTKVYFQLSRSDARALERETRPEIAAHDLAHLPRYTAAVRLCLDGEPTRAFTLATQALDAPVAGRAQVVREAARRRGVTHDQTDRKLKEAEQHRKDFQPEQRAGTVTPRRPVGGAIGDAPADAIGDALRSASPTAPKNPHQNGRSGA
ncbi:MAG: hypothetical protein ACYCUM_14430 [Solirubrobacteraceae bacterium]